MALDWSTFVLEVVNFLVLVWLLKRFLFSPVLRVVAERQAAIDAAQERAHERERRADQLKADYDVRLQSWERERQKLRAEVDDELRKQRERQMAQLNQELEEERTRQQIVADKAKRASALQAEAAAIGQASAFTSRLLGRLAGPELEDRLIAAAIEDLGAVSPSQRREIRDSAAESPRPVVVATAYPLSDERKAEIRAAIAPLKAPESGVEYALDSALIAGVRISIGPWTLHATLADELQAFTNASATSP